MERELSESLLHAIRLAISESKAPELYWHYNDKLSAAQVNRIIAVPDGMNEVEMELLEDCDEYVYNTSCQHVAEILKKFISDIAPELGLSEDEISEDVLKDLVRHYDLHLECPPVETDFDTLLRNTRTRFVLQLDLYQQEQGWQWQSNIEYDDVREALKLFNINPRNVHPKFPNLPYRNGKEYLLPKDMKELWDNATYGGQYVMPINLDLRDYHKNRDYYHTGIVLHKGDEIWMHDYVNGSGSISIPLQKDLTILKKKLDYTFGDDNETAGYGLDEVYGLCQSAWDNTISPIANVRPTPQILPSPEEVSKYAMKGNVITYWQLSSIIRPFNDQRPRWNGSVLAPGELMNWDIDNSLWKSLPKAAKKRLRNPDDKNAYHTVYQFPELIGQVRLIHCNFIVNDTTSEVVWYECHHSDRSYEIFECIKTKLKFKDRIPARV